MKNSNLKNENQNFPPATLRTLQILDCYLEDPSSKTLKTLSEQLDIPFTSLYRIMCCMQECHYIIEDPNRPNYFRLGYKVSQFSNIAFTEKSLIKIALPIMHKISNELNQACQLCVLTDTGVCTIEQYLPKSAITYITALNETISINVSASGKILAALLPAKKKTRFLKKAFPEFLKRTEHTIMDVDLFKEHLKSIEKQGYGTDNEEYAPGIGCISVPIYAAAKEPIAAIGTTGPIELYRSEEDKQKILTYLQQCAKEIGNRIH